MEQTSDWNSLPKEKAKELVDKFSTAMQKADMYGDYDIGEKECAFIAVDELIKLACDYSDYDETVTKEYWTEVKQEIEKL